MQAIITKYIPATNTKGSRIKANAPAMCSCSTIQPHTEAVMIPHDFKPRTIDARQSPLVGFAVGMWKGATVVLFILSVYFLLVFCFSY